MGDVKRWSAVEIWKAFGEEFDYPTELVSAKEYNQLEQVIKEIESRRNAEYHAAASEIAELKKWSEILIQRNSKLQAERDLYRTALEKISRFESYNPTSGASNEARIAQAVLNTKLAERKD